jgi:hypothetical protein
MTKWSGNWACAVAVTAVIGAALAGCGSAPAGPAAARTAPKPDKAVPALCRQTSQAAQARVTRLSGQPSRVIEGASEPGWPGPSGVVTGIVARSLARTMCALPPMPAGALHCPVLLFEKYEVVFIADGRVLPAVTVQATGCRQVTGLGRVRWAARSTALLEELARITTGTQHLGPGAAYSS